MDARNLVQSSMDKIDPQPRFCKRAGHYCTNPEECCSGYCNWFRSYSSIAELFINYRGTCNNCNDHLCDRRIAKESKVVYE